MKEKKPLNPSFCTWIILYPEKRKGFPGVLQQFHDWSKTRTLNIQRSVLPFHGTEQSPSGCPIFKQRTSISHSTWFKPLSMKLWEPQVHCVWSQELILLLSRSCPGSLGFLFLTFSLFPWPMAILSQGLCILTFPLASRLILSKRQLVTAQRPGWVESLWLREPAGESS